MKRSEKAAARKHAQALNRQIRDQRKAVGLHKRELMRAIKKLGHARRRLMRHTAAECRRIKAKTRGLYRGVYARRQSAVNAIACAENRLKALKQYGVKLSAMVDEIALQDALLLRTRPPSTGRSRKAEKQIERVSLERHNIPAELLPLWDRYGQQSRFAPSSKAARWERFLEWAETDEGTAQAYILADEQAASYIAQLEKELQSMQPDTDPPF